MQQMDTFVRDDVMPSWFANALGKALSLLSSQVRLSRDATHVTLAAAANDGVVLSIGGLWRWVEAPITIAHPGGAAAVYPMFATAAANAIVPTPLPYTDDTNYAFGLVIVAPGTTPAISVGVVDVFRHVADVHWDGAQIVRVDQLVPAPTLHSGQHAAGGADPLSPTDIAAVPSGDPSTIQTGDVVWSGATSRAGCVLADGTAYPRADPVYAPLFAKYGTRYGAGDGSTTFNVPNLKDRVPLGASASNPLGTYGGENTHTLSSAEMPSHGHGPARDGSTFWSHDPGHGHGVSGEPAAAFCIIMNGQGLGGIRIDPSAVLQSVPAGTSTADYGVPTNNNNPLNNGSIASVGTGVYFDYVGGGGAHNNMPAYLALNPFIKL